MTGTEAGDEPLDAGLADLVAEQAVTDAVRRRRAARDVAGRARETATWTGTLRDLAEAGTAVRCATVAGSAHRGTIVAVAADHLVLREPDGALTVVAAGAVTTVAAVDGGGAAAGARRAPVDRTLLEVLDRWREDQAACRVVLDGAADELGRLVAVGDDVVSLATPAATVHLRASAIVAVTVR